ncbi:dehalogenase [Chloroflexota bacterium]
MWLIIGLVTGAGLLALILWLRSRGIAVTWYEWLIGAMGLLLMLFTIQNFTASFAEYEKRAAWTFLWMFGLPAMVMFAIACLLPWLRHRKSG